MKVIYKWSVIWLYAKDALKSVVMGVARLLWTIVLVVVNGVAWCYRKIENGIRRHPGVHLLVSLALIFGISAVVHIRMKVRLTTAEWQRDSLELRMDSMRVLYGNNANYFKYEDYKGE